MFRTRGKGEIEGTEKDVFPLDPFFSFLSSLLLVLAWSTDARIRVVVEVDDGLSGEGGEVGLDSSDRGEALLDGEDVDVAGTVHAEGRELD